MARDFGHTNTNVPALYLPGTVAGVGTPMTFAFWAVIDTFGRSILARGGNTYLQGINTSGGWDCYVSPSWQMLGAAGPVQGAGVRQHICIRWGAPGSQIFVNGTPGAAQGPAGVGANGSETVVIGNRGDGNGVWDGRLCEFAIWNIGLSNAEIVRLAKGLSPFHVRRDFQVAYLPMWGGGSFGSAAVPQNEVCMRTRQVAAPNGTQNNAQHMGGCPMAL